MDVSVSIVSHGHDAMVAELLKRLDAAAGADAGGVVRRVLLTFNTPPTHLQAWRGHGWRFELETIHNATPAGFGLNHNRAFARDQALGASDAFVVLNPDVGWAHSPFGNLCAALASDRALGCAYPVQLDGQGRLQDFERLAPTVQRLIRRYVGRHRQEIDAARTPDWVNAAFMLFRREAFQAVGGFDPGYRLYCEDVELCMRLQLAGWRLQKVPEAVVVHAAQRASHRPGRHLGWHVAGLLRLWSSETWRRYSAQRGALHAAPAPAVHPSHDASREAGPH